MTPTLPAASVRFQIGGREWYLWVVDVPGCAIDELLARARARLDRVLPEALAEEVARGAVVVDIRPSEQRVRDGELPGAVVVDRNVLEWRLDPTSPFRADLPVDASTRVVLVCHEGYQSSLAAAVLRDLGFTNAGDVVGGFSAWRAAGLPTTPSAPSPPR